MPASDVTLDPTEVAINRTPLTLHGNVTSGGTIKIDPAGIDFGDAVITAYQADLAIGSTVVDYRLPNRMIRIPLTVMNNQTGTGFNAAREALHQKVGLMQRRGGWFKRQAGMYADVVNATLTAPDVYGELTGVEQGYVLVLECLPDFYGDEIQLDVSGGTGYINGVLKDHGTSNTAVIQGEYPARCRIVPVDTSGNVQHGLLLGVRSQNYDSATTAALVYEANALTPLNGAASASVTGASGGTVIRHSTLPANAWVPIVHTNLVATNTPLTHRGSYRVWVRAHSATATPQLQLAWGVGSLSTSEINSATALPGSGNFYMLDMGEIRLDPAPIGTHQWFGVIQANVAKTNDPISIDVVYLQPLDESSATLAYSPFTAGPPTLAEGDAYCQTGADLSSVGTVVWSNPTNLTGSGGTTCTLAPSQVSHYFKATNAGLSIPTSATITGYQVWFGAQSTTNRNIVDNSIKLVKAGTVTGNEKSVGAAWPTSGNHGPYGSSSDLWGTSLTPTDVNSSTFGVVISALNQSNTKTFTISLYSVWLRVWYSLTTGPAVFQDAVLYASKSAELRSDGMFRYDSSNIPGPITNVYGSLPRLPPSGVEQQPVELFMKNSQGDFGTLPDTGLDASTCSIFYRACYLARP